MNTIDRLTALLACLAATPCLATVLDVTDALKSDAVASVLAYGARHVRGEADGPDYVEGAWEEAFYLAPVVLRARIALDRRVGCRGQRAARRGRRALPTRGCTAPRSWRDVGCLRGGGRDVR